MSKIKVNAIYRTFDGEVNPFGIGCPTLFVRFQGCHIRCYLSTLGNLCDTPEALSLDSDSAEEYTASELGEEIFNRHRQSPFQKITITGGDPLFRHKPETLRELFAYIDGCLDIPITIETSGTIDFTKFRYHNNYMIIDHKGPSTGIAKKLNKLPKLTDRLLSKDTIKFVIYDNEDFKDMCYYIDKYYGKSEAVICAGVYFNSPHINTFDLFELLQGHKMLDRVKINLQAHQLESYRISKEEGRDVGVKI